jgi:hypothetical protein
MTSQIPMRYIEFLGRAEEGIKERDFRGFSKGECIASLASDQNFS